MLELSFRLLMLALFVFLSFGVGPTIFHSSSFVAFLLICIFAHTHIDDLRKYGWLIIYGIVADTLTGVSFGLHALLYILCALLYNIVTHKITAQHATSKMSRILSTVLVVLISTVVYEIAIHETYTFLTSWKNIVSIVVGSVILLLPLSAIMSSLEKSFQDYVLARNFKKHQ